MSAIFRIFKLSVDPENELAYQTIGHQNLEQSMVTETGTLAMYAGHSIDNPLHTVVAEVYQNQAAYETHIASQHFKDFSQMANEALTDRQVIELTPQLLLQKPETMRLTADSDALCLLAQVQLKSGKSQEFGQHVMAEMWASLAKEEGVLTMNAGTVKDNPDIWYFVEVFASKEAQQAHGQTDHFKAYAEATKDLVESKTPIFYKPDLLLHKGGLEYTN